MSAPPWAVLHDDALVLMRALVEEARTRTGENRDLLLKPVAAALSEAGRADLRACWREAMREADERDLERIEARVERIRQQKAGAK